MITIELQHNVHVYGFFGYFLYSIKVSNDSKNLFIFISSHENVKWGKIKIVNEKNFILPIQWVHIYKSALNSPRRVMSWSDETTASVIFCRMLCVKKVSFLLYCFDPSNQKIPIKRRHCLWWCNLCDMKCLYWIRWLIAFTLQTHPYIAFDALIFIAHLVCFRGGWLKGFIIKIPAFCFVLRAEIFPFMRHWWTQTWMI